MAGIAMIRQNRPDVAVELQFPVANKILRHGSMEITIRQEDKDKYSHGGGTIH
jgi:hypothetical protein